MLTYVECARVTSHLSVLRYENCNLAVIVREFYLHLPYITSYVQWVGILNNTK